MASVKATADYLLEAGPVAIDLRVERTIEAGLVITYARPFVSSKGLPTLQPARFEERFRQIHEAWTGAERAARIDRFPVDPRSRPAGRAAMDDALMGGLSDEGRRPKHA
jgi:hypothetical protein